MRANVVLRLLLCSNTEMAVNERKENAMDQVTGTTTLSELLGARRSGLSRPEPETLGDAVTKDTDLLRADLADLDVRQLRTAFNRLRRFVAPNLVDLIVRDCTDALSVHRRAVTVVFFDL